MTNIITDINYDSSQVAFLNEKFGCGKTEAKTMLREHGFIAVLYALELDAMCFEKKELFSEEKNEEARAKFQIVHLINDKLFEHNIGDKFVDLEINPFPGHGCFVEIQSGKVYNGIHLERFEPVPVPTLVTPTVSSDTKRVKIS